MYIRKNNAPIFVKTADGRILTQADLPPKDIKRWVPRRKAQLLEAIIYGLITEEDAEKIYSVSSEELNEWKSSARLHGKDGLYVTRRFSKAA